MEIINLNTLLDKIGHFLKEEIDHILLICTFQQLGYFQEFFATELNVTKILIIKKGKVLKKT